MKEALLVFLVSSLLMGTGQAQTLVFSNNFSSGYVDGNLVGQNGWSQTGTTATAAQTVSGGFAVLPSGATGQDTWNAFSSTVDTTVIGNYLLTTINFSITNAANTTGDYFFHLSSPTNTTSNFYQRLFSRSATGGFQLGISGASAATSAAWGTNVLSLNTTYKAVVKWDFVTGGTNDVLSLYVNPTDPIIANNPVYASTNWIVAEPTTLTAANLRIGSASSTPGVLVSSIDVQVIPEPSSQLLLALGLAGLAGMRAMRRRQS